MPLASWEIFQPKPLANTHTRTGRLIWHMRSLVPFLSGFGSFFYYLFLLFLCSFVLFVCFLFFLGTMITCNDGPLHHHYRLSECIANRGALMQNNSSCYNNLRRLRAMLPSTHVGMQRGGGGHSICSRQVEVGATIGYHSCLQDRLLSDIKKYSLYATVFVTVSFPKWVGTCVPSWDMGK